MKDLRERCEKLVHELSLTSDTGYSMYAIVNNLESFAREIRNDALAEAAQICNRERTRQINADERFERLNGQDTAHLIGTEIRTLALAVEATETLK